MHVKLPGVSVQVARALQPPLLTAHSSTSTPSQVSKQASLVAQLMNIHIISMIVTHKGRLPEKPIRPNIAGRLAKKNSSPSVDKTVVVKCGRPKSTGVRENATFCYGVLGQVLEECRTRILFLPFQITSDNKHTNNCHVGSGINYQNVPVRSYWCKTVRIQFIYLTP